MKGTQCFHLYAASSLISTSSPLPSRACLPARRQMERSLVHLQGELANIRTGRATPGMLDHLKVRGNGG